MAGVSLPILVGDARWEVEGDSLSLGLSCTAPEPSLSADTLLSKAPLPATIRHFRVCLRPWISPLLGNRPLHLEVLGHALQVSPDLSSWLSSSPMLLIPCMHRSHYVQSFLLHIWLHVKMTLTNVAELELLSRQWTHL